jgi:tetratricopeptide (TPR) repeat protein
MPLERFTSAETSQNLRRNRVSIWPDGRLASGRMGVYASCEPSPSFEFMDNDAFFTMGSCFAREVEKNLVKAGLKAPMTELALPKEEMISGTANEILNKYTPFAMLNEIRWALTGETPPDEHLYLLADAEKDLWADPHLHPELKPAPLARLKQRRADVLQLTRSILETRVIIFTMGLVEAWYDNQSGLYLNGSPPKLALSSQPERFELHVLSYEDIMVAMEELYTLIGHYCRKDVRILITVSPVPFKATLTGRDALAANTYSKSVLRTIAESFVRRHENVDYFPSYEIVTLSDRVAAYWIDNIHVRPEMVERIMNQVFAAYMPQRAEQFVNVTSVARDDDRTGPGLYAKAVKFMRDGAFVDAANHLHMAIETYGIDGLGVPASKVHVDLGNSYISCNRPEQGELEFRKALAIDPKNASVIQKFGLALAHMKRSDEALAAFKEAIALTPEPSFIWRLGVEYQRLGRLSEAREAFKTSRDFGDSATRLAEVEVAIEASGIIAKA